MPTSWFDGELSVWCRGRGLGLIVMGEVSVGLCVPGLRGEGIRVSVAVRIAVPCSMRRDIWGVAKLWGRFWDTDCESEWLYIPIINNTTHAVRCEETAAGKCVGRCE